MRSVVVSAQAGCFLPILIILNLFFGWMFLKPAQWLLLEAALVLFFIITSIILVKKVVSSATKRSNVIDVEGKVVDENKYHRKTIDG